MAPLAAKGPVLVHFFDFSQLNSVRTLPYLNEWQQRYEPLGLRIIGVQAPRFTFGADPEAVRTGVERLGVRFPVVIDDQRALWNSYGCEGWPSLFLWGRGGRLKWFQFGEGEYRSTEEAIQAALAGPPDRCSSEEPEQAAADEVATGVESSNGSGPSKPAMPELMAPLRATDVEGVKVVAPGTELMPAGDRPWTIAEDGDFLDVTYEAGGVHATMSGTGSIAFRSDGEVTGLIELDGPGLYSLAEHDRHGQHRIEIRLVEGTEAPPELWSLSFSPAVAD
ncbi:MAG: hypothetical protein WD181_04640 [Solirubrobacterales bacterium]